MYFPGSAPTGQPLAQILRGPGALKHESVLGSAPFCFRQLAAMARGSAVSQAKPLPKGRSRAAGFNPGKSFGPRPHPVVCQTQDEPSHTYTCREQRRPSLPPSQSGSQALLVMLECPCSPGAQAASSGSHLQSQRRPL